jgi:hypothetical protein
VALACKAADEKEWPLFFKYFEGKKINNLAITINK